MSELSENFWFCVKWCIAMILGALFVHLFNYIFIDKSYVTSSSSFKLTCNKIAVLPISDDFNSLANDHILTRKIPKITKAVVKVVGKRCDRKGYLYDLIVKVGDIIIYETNNGVIISINDATIVIMNESDVIAILPNENNLDE